MSSDIDEQRRRGMEGRNERLHPSSLFGRNVTRRISPYVTRAFLRMGLSANQCTVLRIAVTVVVGYLVTFPDPRIWLIAPFVGYMAIVLDCVDGELARTNGTSSAEGIYFESLSSQFAQPFVIACMAVGLYRELGGLLVVGVGLAATLGSSLAVAHTPLARAAAWEWKLPTSNGGATLPRRRAWMVLARRLASVLLTMRGLVYLPHMLVVSLIDVFAGGFVVAGIPLNARLAWLALFAGGTLLAAVVRGAVTVRNGLSTEL